MKKLLPDRLLMAWQDVAARYLTPREFEQRQAQWLREYRVIWEDALLFGGRSDLTESLLTEISLFTGDGLAEVESRCRRAVTTIAGEWTSQVETGSRDSIEHFYDQNESYVYDLMWWHTLHDDNSPLSYVTALDFARRNRCSRSLDFGSGVGSGAILFAQHDFEVALADISSTLLGFSAWRLEQRNLPARLFDLKVSKLPGNAFDMITAMDVFEHLADPVGTIDELHRALKSGGYLFGRFHAEVDKDHPQHIVFDFAPTFTRLRELGFVEVWRDEWLWGHQVFQKQI